MAADLDTGRATLTETVQRTRYRLSFLFAALFIASTSLQKASKAFPTAPEVINQAEQRLRGLGFAIADDLNNYTQQEEATPNGPRIIEGGASSSSSSASAEQSRYIRQRRRPSIVLFGDSITQRGFSDGDDDFIGWVSLLSGAYTRRADVKNRGFGGYNTHHALHVWPNIEEAYEDKVLFTGLFFGANDAALPGNPQHLSLTEYRDNLIQLVTKMRTKLVETNPEEGHNIPIFLFTPPPVDEEKWGQHRNKGGSNRSNAAAREYGNMVKQVALELIKQQPQQYSSSLTVVDTWEMLRGDDANLYPLYLKDGLHLNVDGNRKIYQELMALIRRDYPSLAPNTPDSHDTGIPFEQKKWQDFE